MCQLAWVCGVEGWLSTISVIHQCLQPVFKFFQRLTAIIIQIAFDNLLLVGLGMGKLQKTPHFSILEHIVHVDGEGIRRTLLQRQRSATESTTDYDETLPERFIVMISIIYQRQAELIVGRH